jgi:hypothetical protein
MVGHASGKSAKVKNWRGFPAIFALQGAPVLDFDLRQREKIILAAG